MKPLHDLVGATRKEEPSKALLSMSEFHLPIGVVLPTLNVRAALPEHLEQMRSWLELVDEVVVVDSFSTDGTFELLQAELHHPRLRLFQRPPGLYQAWNYGIERLTARFTYVSTVGDPITAGGLQHLAVTAEEFRSDVVISRPELLDAAGQPMTDKRWPIDNLLDWCAPRQPLRVESWRAFVATMLNVPEGILGSSASNLYRTATLQRFPFQPEYGHEADTAWAIAHALEVSWALTPRVVSKFTFHSGAGLLSMERMAALNGSLLDLARQTLRRPLDQASPAPVPEGLLPWLRELPAALENLRECQRRYNQARARLLPWLFNPAAWRARAQRNYWRARLPEIRTQILRWPA
jgi:hypothetical protein